MIKNIIFDLGNVLTNFDPMAYVSSKISDKEKCRNVYEEIFKSKEWTMLDRGIITEREAVNAICSRNVQDDKYIRLVMNNWYELLTPIEGTVEILKKLHSNGYKNYILSNYHMTAYRSVTKRFNFFSCFDGGVISYMEKLLKPERNIYYKLIEKYGIEPSKSVFIDDSAENIESAEQIGFETILFVDPADLRKRLNKYGVL